MTKYLAIVQAHLGSKRLKEKMLKKIYKNKTVIEILLERLKNSKLIDKIVVATSINKENDKLVDLLRSLNVDVYRGDKSNVLKRYFLCAKKFNIFSQS